MPRNIENGAAFTCTADANPPVSRYEWTLVPSGVVQSMSQTLTLTEDLVFGQLTNFGHVVMHLLSLVHSREVKNKYLVQVRAPVCWALSQMFTSGS